MLKRVFKNDYLIGILCMVINFFVGILYSMLLARYLGPSIKGEVAYISGLMNIFSVILSFGMHQAYAYYRKNNPDVKDKYMSNMFAIFALYAVLSVAVCVFFAGNTVVVATTVLSIFAAYVRIAGYVYLVENASKRNIIMLFVHILQLGYIVILKFSTKANLLYGISTLIFVDAVLAVIYTWKLKIKLSFADVSVKYILKIVRFGFVPMITILASNLNYRVDVIMLKAFPNVSMADIGVYSIGVMLAEKVLLVPVTVKQILLSKLAKGKTAKEVALVLRICFPVCFLMFAGISAFGQPFINIVYGAGYENAYGVTVITMFGVCAAMFGNIIEVFNVVNNKQIYTLAILIGSVAVNVVVNMFLIPRMGITGAAFATVVSFTCSALAFLITFSRQTGIKLRELILITKEDILMCKNFFKKDRR